MELKKHLYHLSGSDHRILVQCEQHLQYCFLFLGVSVLLFGFLSTVSSYFAFLELFGSRLLSLTLAVFFAWMFSNLYRLMLYAAARDPLPQSKEGVNAAPTWVLRIFFICLMTLLVSKPLECLLYKTYLDTDIRNYKVSLKQDTQRKISGYYIAQIAEVKSMSIDPAYQVRFINEKQQASRLAIAAANARLENCGFFLQRLRFLVSRHTSCWYLTSALGLLFFCPLLIRYALRSCAYENQRTIAERRIVRVNYYSFYKKYKARFLTDQNQIVVFNSSFSDAPYNTTKKEDERVFLKEKQFLAEFYHA